MKNNLGRSVLRCLLDLEQNSIDIHLHNMDDKGRLKFSFEINILKDEEVVSEIINCDSIMKAVGTHYCDMIGQLVIRDNPKRFFEFFSQIDNNDYAEKVIRYDHVHFGIGSDKEVITLLCHCSLLYDMFVGMVDNVETGDKNNG